MEEECNPTESSQVKPRIGIGTTDDELNMGESYSDHAGRLLCSSPRSEADQKVFMEDGISSGKAASLLKTWTSELAHFQLEKYANAITRVSQVSLHE